MEKNSLKRFLGPTFILGVIAVSGVFFFPDLRSGEAALNSKFVEQVGTGFIAPACGSSSASVTCSGGAPSAVIAWTGDDFIGDETPYRVVLDIYSPPPSVEGTWYENGDLSRPVSIVQSSASLTFTNIISGFTSSGFFRDLNTVIYKKGGSTGILNGNLDRIDWDDADSTVWTRSNPTPVFGTLVFSQLIRPEYVYYPGTPDSFTWNGGNSDTTYSYVLHNGFTHDISTGSFTTPVCTPPSSFNYTLLNSGTSNVTKTSGNAFTQNTITKTLTLSTTEPVTLSLSGVPGGTSYSISNSACSPTCFSVITFTVSPGTAAGTYPITVTGTPLGKQTGFNLAISGNPMNVTCSASPSTALLGQTVTWTANVSGGTSPFTYSWSGTNFPTSPAPSTNPFSIIYSTIGQKIAAVTVTDTDSVTATCLAGTVQINFDPNFEEF